MDTSYPLRDFLEKFTLPQLVKVQKGYYDEYQRRTFRCDAVYNLLRLESVDTVLFEDADGVERRIPIDYPCTVERAAEERFLQELSIQELLQENHPAVKFVRVIQSDPNFETLIKAGDKLKIDLRKKKSRDNFLPFKIASDKDKTLWKVPASCEAKVQGLWDGEEVLLSKFVKKNKLPAYVSFVRDRTKGSTEEEATLGKEKGIQRIHPCPLPTGVVKLKGILTDSFVSATISDANSETSPFLFPKTLPIGVLPVEMAALRSPLSDSLNTNTEIVEHSDYEDMSGIQAKLLKPPHPETPFHGGSGSRDKAVTIEELEVTKQRMQQGNTYSPPPSFKVMRSKSMMEQKKGSGLLQRSVSNRELRTNPIENEGQIYEELNFTSLTGKPNSYSLPPMERRRSDSTKDQVSSENLSNLLHTLAKNQEDEKMVETVSLQIRKTSLDCDKPSTRMKTFGRKANTTETESIFGNANTSDPVLKKQSYSINRLQQTSSTQETSSPFYSSDEMDVETPHLHTQSIFLASHVRRSSGDALPPLPTLQESCPEEELQRPCRHPSLGVKSESSGRRRLTGGEVKVLPTNPTRKGIHPKPPKTSDRNTNQKAREQPSLGSGFEKNVCRDENDSSKSIANEDDTPPPVPSRNKHSGEVSCPELPPKAISAGDKAFCDKDCQPIPSPRAKSRSFHGQGQNERPVTPSHAGQSTSVSAPSSRGKTRSYSGSSLEGLNLQLVVVGDNPSSGTQTKPNAVPYPQKTKAETAFNIPEDLTNLRVAEVLRCLQALNMQQFEEIFKERQVDGSMLVCLDEEALKSFGMDRFHRLKLLRVIDGWRPQL